jgi:hypothetical protein
MIFNVDDKKFELTALKLEPPEWITTNIKFHENVNLMFTDSNKVLTVVAGAGQYASKSTGCQVYRYPLQ